MPAPLTSIIDGTLHVEGASAVELARRFGTPLFVFSERCMQDSATEVRRAFAGGPVPVKVHYAAKANSNLAVLQVVCATGIDVEVNSAGELHKALAAGFSPLQVVFNGVAKTTPELQYALRSGLRSINVDSPSELQRLLAIAAAEQRTAAIALRIVPEVPGAPLAGIATGTVDGKFGMTKAQALAACRELQQHPHIRLVGLHSHIGAQITHAERFASAFTRLLAVASEIRRTTGQSMSSLNLGGGLPVCFLERGAHEEPWSTKPRVRDLHTMLAAGVTPAQVAQAVFDSMDHADMAAIGSPELWIEPGARIVAEAGLVLTEVQACKDRPGLPRWLLCDAGFNVLLDTLTYHWYYPVRSASRADEPHTAPFRLGGPLCDSGDVFHDSDGQERLPSTRSLPAATATGDVLAILHAGAYGLEQMCQYNGQPRAAAVMVRASGEVVLVRRREHWDDLLRDDQGLPSA
jgi:diaminopimelate decarboxylase